MAGLPLDEEVRDEIAILFNESSSVVASFKSRNEIINPNAREQGPPSHVQLAKTFMTHNIMTLEMNVISDLDETADAYSYFCY